MGNPRRTLDIDIALASPQRKSSEFINTMESLAKEMKLEVEVIPIEDFIPLPEDADTRHQQVSQYGSLVVFVYDPYSIALSKIARGFETDIQDVLFLIRNNFIIMEELTRFVGALLPQAWDFDIDPDEMMSYFKTIQQLSAKNNHQ